MIKVSKVIPVQREGIISSPVHCELRWGKKLQQREERYRRSEAQGPTPTCLEESFGI